MKKLYEENNVQSIADAIRSKRNVQLNPVGKMKVNAMADAIAKIRLGTPITVSMHSNGGVWTRPDGWTDLDTLAYENDELYMTFDASERIEDSHAAFTITGVSYTVTIGSQSWTKADGEAFSYGFTDADGTYPLVHVKADGNITSFTFNSYTVDGKSYSARQNPMVERVGDVYDYGTGEWGTYYLEHEKVIRHACMSVDSGLSTTWYCCYSLQSLDVSGWDTSKWAVTSLSNTWQSCYSLQSLDVSGWDTSKWAVTDMSRMIYGCSALTSLKFTFDVSKGTQWGSSATPSAVSNMLTTFSCGSANYGKFAPTSYIYLNISASKCLTHESILEFGKMLGTVTTKHYFVLGSELSSKLTTAEKTEITAKGWTIS